MDQKTPIESASDEDLAKAVQDGDLQAFDALLKRYYKKILRYGRRFLLGVQDSEDAAQTIFLKAYRFIKSYNTSRKFSPWIYGIAHNEFINLGKKREKQQVEFFDDDEFFPHPSVDKSSGKDLSDLEIKGILDECLDQLAAKYREPVVLYFLEDLDYKQIAQILRLPISTVGTRIKRAKYKLKEVSKAYKDML